MWWKSVSPSLIREGVPSCCCCDACDRFACDACFLLLVVENCEAVESRIQIIQIVEAVAKEVDGGENFKKASDRKL